jgi:uncharacterized integral membrane protein
MSTATLTSPQSNETLLRRTFQINAVVTGLMGIGFVVAASPITGLIGLDQPWVVLAIGVGLIGFAGLLYRNAVGDTIRHAEALAIMVGDFAWVIASGIVILLGILNTTGNWATAIVADVVLAFAILEWIGIRRMMKR